MHKQSWFRPALALLAVVFAIYLPTLGYDFVNWDDPWYVINNPLNKSWDFATLKAIATEVINRNYAPLTMFVLLVEHTLFGLEPAGYHFVNTLLHGINAVLVFVLLRQLTGRASIGFWTALLFAVHPIQLESVVWVSSLKGLLCSTFILAHLICWLRPERTPQQAAYGMLFFLLALLSKALTVVVPAIVLLYDVWVCRKKLSDAIARQFITGMLSIWLLLTTMQAQETSLGGIRSHFELSKLHILAVDSVILWKYVGMLLWPHDLCVLYDPPTTGIALAVSVSVVGWLGVVLVLTRSRERAPLAVLAAATCLVLLLPVLNLTRITTLMNDRYLYLPSVPFFALLVAGWVKGIEWLQTRHAQSPSNAASTTVAIPFERTGRVLEELATRHLWLRAALPAIAVFGFSIASVFHLPVWRNDQALWEATVARLPHVPVVRIQYAWMLHYQGETEFAIAVMKKTLHRFAPDELDRVRIQETILDWKSDSDRSGA